MTNERMTDGPRPTMLRLVTPPAPRTTPGPELYPSRDPLPPDFESLLDGLGPIEAAPPSRLRPFPPRAEVPTLPEEPSIPSAPDSPSIPDPSVPEPSEPITPAVPSEPVVPADPVPGPEVPDPEPAEAPAH